MFLDHSYAHSGYIALLSFRKERQDHLWGQPPHFCFYKTILSNQWFHSSWVSVNKYPGHLMVLLFSSLVSWWDKCLDCFEASNVQKSSQGIRSTWASIKVFWLLVSAAESLVLYSAPGPSDCCQGPRCTHLCRAEQRILQTKQAQHVNTHKINVKT